MLTNAVLVSVLVMVVVSLFRVNVLFAIILAALTAGLMSGMSLAEAAELMVSGMGGQSNTALSYVLLGIFAVMIGLSGITTTLVNKMLILFKGKKTALVLTIAGIACLSQNIIPVHIAFIPILIPPLLGLFNKLKLDRRAVAAALTFGLKAPYMTIPVGFGLIFQGIIRDEMIANNMAISLNEVTISMLIPGAGMVVGLFVAIFITYRKDHLPKEGNPNEANTEVAYTQEGRTWGFYQWMTIVGIIVALVTQLITESLILGALAGIIVLFVTRVIKMNENEKVVQQGIGMMGMIAFIMLVASGYATVLQETGDIEQLVEQAISMVGTSSFLIATTMLVVGLFITMGIGTSFGTIPILAALYVPICAAAGLSPLATAALIGTAGAMGDAGSPASDSTLGPTAGLNADGRHHHIWNTCVPTFLHYNIPLFIFGVIAAVIL
ncbi:Na+/H+ antiporter family protein [Oceanobacillus locisalsi]|uniref:Na+/H+ antiporter family protein n=1 Tax=Oceanobacillus locisalsi TaxID=546107 RepID=A0ABW3NEU8_9BACI